MVEPRTATSHQFKLGDLPSKCPQLGGALRTRGYFYEARKFHDDLGWEADVSKLGMNDIIRSL